MTAYDLELTAYSLRLRTYGFGRAGQEAGRTRSWPGRRRLALRSCGLAWAMQGQAVGLPSCEAAIFQSESPLWTVMLGGCTRERSSDAGTTSMAPGWRRRGSEIVGLAARRAFQREPLPRWRRASFQRESPGWMRIWLAPGGVMEGATGALGGTSEGRAGTGFAGSNNFGAAVGGGAAWIAGARGAGAVREMDGLAGAEKFGASGARSLGSA